MKSSSSRQTDRLKFEAQSKLWIFFFCASSNKSFNLSLYWSPGRRDISILKMWSSWIKTTHFDVKKANGCTFDWKRSGCSKIFFSWLSMPFTTESGVPVLETSYKIVLTEVLMIKICGSNVGIIKWWFCSRMLLAK